MSAHAPHIRAALGLRAGAGRYWELDLVRGIAVAVMVCYHLLWNLQNFQIFGAMSDEFFFTYIAPVRYAAAVFIVLVGAALTLSYRRALQRGDERLAIFKRFLLRGVIIFAFGLLITVVVLIAGLRIDFGILHLIGFSIAVSFPLLRYGVFNLALGVAIVLAGFLYVATVNVETPWLIWFGFTPALYGASDYFPVFPWFGFALIGVGLGNLLYRPPAGRAFKIPDLSSWVGVRQLTVVGRSALFIYLIHQPILFPTVFVLSLIV